MLINSTPPSRAAPHDSGPMWVAIPLSCDFSIHYNLAGLTGEQEKAPGNQESQKDQGAQEAQEVQEAPNDQAVGR